MNRILIIMCALGLAIALGACKGQADRDSERTKTETENMRNNASGEGLAGSMDETEDSARAQAGAETDTAGGSARLAVATKPPFGQYLTDGTGRSVYLFAADQQGGESTCEDACAQAWPPLTVAADQSAKAGSGVDESKLGTVERPDGSKQVTYDGYPLYYFARDASRGDTSGQAVNGFGAEWYLVSPDGQPIREPGAAGVPDSGFQQGVDQINEDDNDM